MPNSIDFYKRILLHVIPAPIIVSCIYLHKENQSLTKTNKKKKRQYGHEWHKNLPEDEKESLVEYSKNCKTKKRLIDLLLQLAVVRQDPFSSLHTISYENCLLQVNIINFFGWI